MNPNGGRGVKIVAFYMTSKKDEPIETSKVVFYGPRFQTSLANGQWNKMCSIDSASPHRGQFVFIRSCRLRRFSPVGKALHPTLQRKNFNLGEVMDFHISFF